MHVAPDLLKHSEILAHHIRWIDDTEDWKGEYSKRHHILSQRLEEYGKAASVAEGKRQEERRWIESEFADIRHKIVLVQATIKHFMTLAIVLWVVLTTLAGILMKFL
jgi:hypothetical protein